MKALNPAKVNAGDIQIMVLRFRFGLLVHVASSHAIEKSFQLLVRRIQDKLSNANRAQMRVHALLVHSSNALSAHARQLDELFCAFRCHRMRLKIRLKFPFRTVICVAHAVSGLGGLPAQLTFSSHLSLNLCATGRRYQSPSALTTAYIK